MVENVVRELNASGFLYAISSSTHPGGCTQVVVRDERVSHFDSLVFVDIRPTDFAKSSEYLLMDTVGRGSKGCAEI